MRISICFSSSIILGCFLLTSCVDDLRNLETVESLEYTPSFSIPIGPISYTLGEIMPPDSLLNFEIPDSILQYDTVDRPMMVYNDSRYFYAPEFGYETTFRQDISFANLSPEFQYVESAMLKTIFTNNLPIALSLQGYLLNDQSQVMDSIFQDGLVMINSPEINSEGIITQPSEHTFYTHYDSDNVDFLMDVTQLDVYIFLQTYSGELDTLYIYSSNGIHLQLGLRADLSVPIMP